MGQSIYAIEKVLLEGKNGFTVIAPDRKPAYVVFSPPAAAVVGVVDEEYWTYVLPVLGYHKILEALIHILYSSWSRPHKYARDYSSGQKIERWARGRTKMAIGPRFHKEWLDMLSLADPKVIGVQRKFFASTFKWTNDVASSWVYEDKYIVRDLMKYRAASHVLYCLDTLLSHHGKRRVNELIAENADIVGLRDRYGVEPAARIMHRPVPDQSKKIAMANWVDLLSENETMYRSLNRTLMNLPGKMSSRLFCWFPEITLTRPITDRVELTTVLSYAEFASEQALEERRHIDTVMNARRNEIIDGWRIFARSTNRGEDFTHRTNDIRVFMGWLADFPDSATGNFVGTVKRCAAWHRDFDMEKHFKYAREVGYGAKTAMPPIPLPEDGSVKFLDTAYDVANEGFEMQHCVSGYVEKALNGSSYLFSILRDGERATAEVSNSGRIVQVSGQRNYDNKTCKWAQSYLKDWASGLSVNGECLPPVIRHEQRVDVIEEAVPF